MENGLKIAIKKRGGIKLLKEDEKCCICGGDFEQKYGNNALPVKDGRCCTKCDNEVVIPERIRRTYYRID